MNIHPKVSIKKLFVAYRNSVEPVTVCSLLRVPIFLSDFLLGHNPKFSLLN
jgi:hypothetical protein